VRASRRNTIIATGVVIVAGLGIAFLVATSGSSSSAHVVLGQPFGSYQHGFGTIAPHSVQFGGDGTADVANISWHDWGKPTATGYGTGDYVPSGRTSAEGFPAPATVKAFGLAHLKGKAVYTQWAEYFPEYGDQFKVDDSVPITPSGQEAETNRISGG
jgi:hypothetical protein